MAKAGVGLGRDELVSVIARGGMATVYEARQLLTLRWRRGAFAGAGSRPVDLAARRGQGRAGRAPAIVLGRPGG